MSRINNNNDWKVNDGVYIEQSNGRLTGVVAFVGPVRFSEGNDWVGVRLTGESQGKGRNDGTVKGVKYFDNCPPNGGMFVKESALTRRTLSRLEDLRMKREGRRAKGGSGGSVSAGGEGKGRDVVFSPSVRRPRRRPGTGGGDGADDDTSISSMSMVSTATGATSGTNRSKIEELRKKREAMKKGRLTPTTPVVSTKVSSTPSPRAATAASTDVLSPSTPRARMTPTLETIPAGSSPVKTQIQSTAALNKAQVENDHLKTKIEILEDKLRSSEAERSTLQENFDMCTKESHEMKLKLNEMKDSMEQIQEEADKKIASAVAASDDNDFKSELNQLKEEILDLQSKNDELMKEHKEQMDRVQIKFQSQMTAVQESFEQDLSQKESTRTTSSARIE